MIKRPRCLVHLKLPQRKFSGRTQAVRRFLAPGEQSGEPYSTCISSTLPTV